MNLLSLLLTIGTLLSTQALAQNYFDINRTGPSMLKCDFSKHFAPSKELADITNSRNPVAHCFGKEISYEIAFVGVNFKANSDEFGKEPSLNLRCSGENISGVYSFGGYPAGFATQGTTKYPWFYKITDGRASGERCSVEYNSKAITGIEAEQHKSAMVLLAIEP